MRRNQIKETHYSAETNRKQTQAWQIHVKSLWELIWKSFEQALGQMLIVPIRFLTL